MKRPSVFWGAMAIAGLLTGCRNHAVAVGGNAEGKAQSEVPVIFDLSESTDSSDCAAKLAAQLAKQGIDAQRGTLVQDGSATWFRSDASGKTVKSFKDNTFTVECP